MIKKKKSKKIDLLGDPAVVYLSEAASKRADAKHKESLKEKCICTKYEVLEDGHYHCIACGKLSGLERLIHGFKQELDVALSHWRDELHAVKQEVKKLRDDKNVQYTSDINRECLEKMEHIRQQITSLSNKTMTQEDLLDIGDRLFNVWGRLDKIENFMESLLNAVNTPEGK